MDKAFRKNYIILLIFTSILLYAGKDEELFLQGNTYYQAKDYQNALSTYTDIQQKGRAVLSAMGNCYFYMQDYAQALTYWLRAQDGASFTEYNTIEQNKELLYKAIQKEQPRSLITSINKFFNTIALHIPLLFLQILFLLCCYIMALYIRNQKKEKNRLFLGCFYFSLFMFSILMSFHYKKVNTRYAVVTQEKTYLLAGPHKDFHQLKPVTYADSVIIKESRDGWHKVQYTDMIGWVEANALQIV